MVRPIIAILYECARWPNESRVYPILPSTPLVYRKASVVSNKTFGNYHNFFFYGGKGCLSAKASSSRR